MRTRLVVFVACAFAACGTNHDSRRVEPVAAPSTTTSTSPSTTTTTAAPPPIRIRASRSRPPRPLRVGVDDATKQRVIAAIYAYSDWDAALMVHVASCESGLDPWKVNRSSGATGIFQIMGGVTPGLIEEHVALAHSMWQRSGLSKWSESRFCWSR